MSRSLHITEVGGTGCRSVELVLPFFGELLVKDQELVGVKQADHVSLMPALLESL